jgi:hypothetical protein
MGTSLGGTAFHVDGTTHAAQRFGPLKSILGAIHEVYANDEVRSRHLARVLL